jgi:hypothetical protein
MALYRLFVPKQAVGASLVYFDFFNVATSGLLVKVQSVLPVVSGAVAVSGLVGVDLLLTRTTAVGTGGTAATAEGTDTTACTISCHDGNQAINLAKVSARLTPSGGATAGAVLSWSSVYTEEANSATYNPLTDMVRFYYDMLPGLPVPAGSGIRVVQGSVASVGNIGFNVLFTTEPAP